MIQLLFEKKVIFLFKIFIKSFNSGNVQHAVTSSVPSAQSFLPSHNCCFVIHFGAPLGPPCGHRNLLSGHAIAVQFASSLKISK